jgi:hypothetical protein
MGRWQVDDRWVTDRWLVGDRWMIGGWQTHDRWVTDRWQVGDRWMIIRKKILTIPKWQRNVQVLRKFSLKRHETTYVSFIEHLFHVGLFFTPLFIAITSRVFLCVSLKTTDRQFNEISIAQCVIVFVFLNDPLPSLLFRLVQKLKSILNYYFLRSTGISSYNSNSIT